MPLTTPVTDSLPLHGLLLLLVALVFEPVVGQARGPLARLPHPVRLIGQIVTNLELKLNRDDRAAIDRRTRGVLLVLVVVAAAGVSGAAVTAFGRSVPFGWLLELALIISLLAQRSLYAHVNRVAVALATEGLAAGQRAVAHIVGRDVRRLDAARVARAAIESCAENFSDAVVAPVFWYVIFGLPGLLIYKAVNTMDSMIGHRSPRYLAFGWAAARLDDAMNLLPARLAGVFIALAAMVVPRTDPFRSLQIMWCHASRHRSPNAGWPEAAMAGALDLSLAGPRRYVGFVADDRWIGAGTAEAGPRDIRRALSLFVGACAINTLFVALLAGLHLR